MKIFYKTRLFVALLLFCVITFSLYGYLFDYNIFNIFFIKSFSKSMHSQSFGFYTLFLLFVILTLFFGRIYCSIVCPIGFLQEILLCIKQKNNFFIKNNYIKYYIGSVLWGTIIGGCVYFFKYVEPSVLFSSVLTVSLYSICVVTIILLLAFYTNRLFCRCICPVGLLLGLFSKISFFKIKINENDCISCKKCEKNCPVSCISTEKKIVDNEICLKCFKCIDVCSSNAIKYTIKNNTQKQGFSVNRRKFIFAFSCFAIYTTVAKTTGLFTKDINSKFKNAILPPGAINNEHFINNCYNCNLCVTSCPSNIIVKSNKNFPVVHIDYEKGYCQDNCTKCSDVCPFGAIKKITLEQKKELKIANAKIVNKECTHCDLCIKACKYGAIIKEGNKLPIIDNQKCIGCGACKSVCDSATIDLFPLDSQINI